MNEREVKQEMLAGFMRFEAQQLRRRLIGEENTLDHMIISTPTGKDREELTAVNLLLKEAVRRLGGVLA